MFSFRAQAVDLTGLGDTQTDEAPEIPVSQPHESLVEVEATVPADSLGGGGVAAPPEDPEQTAPKSPLLPMPPPPPVEAANGEMLALSQQDAIALASAKPDQAVIPTVLPPKKLTRGAIQKRLRRVCTPKANGQLKVPKEVMEDYHDDRRRGDVEALFEKSGYQRDCELGSHGKSCVDLSVTTELFASSAFSQLCSPLICSFAPGCFHRESAQDL